MTILESSDFNKIVKFKIYKVSKSVKLSIFIFGLLFFGFPFKLNAAIMFTSDVEPKTNIFQAAVGDTIELFPEDGDISSRAENTDNGFTIFTPRAQNPDDITPAIQYFNPNGNGEGNLSVGFVSRTFDVNPSSKVTFTLSVFGEFEVLGGELITVTPDLTLRNSLGGDPIITYSSDDQNFVNVQSGQFRFSKSATTKSKISMGELELSGGFILKNLPESGVIFRFPGSIDASVSTPEPSSVLSLFAFISLFLFSTYRNKLK